MLQMFARLRGIPHNMIEDVVTDVIQQLNLAKWADKLCGTYRYWTVSLRNDTETERAADLYSKYRRRSCDVLTSETIIWRHLHVVYIYTLGLGHVTLRKLYETFDVKSLTSPFGLFTFYPWNSCSAKLKIHSKRLWQNLFL